MHCRARQGMTVAMRFRLGLALGFGAGLYLGSAAGRGPHEQINRTMSKLRGTDAFEVATDKAKAVVDLGVERARDIVESHLPDATNGTATYSSSK